jgi:hypothetical protein
MMISYIKIHTVAIAIGARLEQIAIRFNMGGEGETESQ